MAKDPAPADVPVLTSQEEWILREMLGPDFRDAIVEARTRTGDHSIMCRIGENPNGDGNPYPADFIPGLVSIHRDGHDAVLGLAHDDALTKIAALA